jgi:bifunctional non-homologous end joining protein LigD
VPQGHGRDLDPHGRSFDDIIEVALGVKSILDSAGVKSYVKTSGKTGMHLMVPLGAEYTYLQAQNFAKLMSRCVSVAMPQLTTLEQRLNKRNGKIYIDIARNSSARLPRASIGYGRIRVLRSPPLWSGGR